MATLSSPGIGSGLDINAIVSQLMALERRPLDLLQQANTKLDTQISAFGKLQSTMTTLRDAARRLTDAGSWTPTKVSSGNAAAVSASSTGLAPPGSYSVSVTNLASAQTLVSNAPLSAASIGDGTLTIELGTWGVDAGSGDPLLTPKAGSTPVTVTIAPGADSLGAVRDAINAAGAGVTASIVNDATGARLSLRSSTTGAENGFRISVSEGDSAGLARLAYDPSDTGLVSQMDRPLAAGNANAFINGVPISSATNTLTDVIDGLTLTLSQQTTANVDLVVERDNAVIKKSVTDFANAYNELVKLLREQTRYDDASKKAGALQGDRSAVGLQSQLRTLIGSSTGASSVFGRLSDIGLVPQRDGTLLVEDGKLDSAMANLPELKAFFSQDADGTANDGFGVLMRSLGDTALSTEGILTTRPDGLKSRMERNTDGIERMELRLELVEKRLRDTYTRLDTNLANLSGLQNYVSQQITNWNKSS